MREQREFTTKIFFHVDISFLVDKNSVFLNHRDI